MYRFLHLIVLPGSVILADDYAGTGGKTQEKADEHIDDWAHGTDSGIGFVADIVADDPGVHRIIQLLEQIADEKGKGKGDDMPGDITFGHIHIPLFADGQGSSMNGH
jgi:hypothetical protein